jgi:hypothetical protein
MLEIQTTRFTPLESSAIYGGGDIDRVLIPYRKGGINVPSLLTGFTKSLDSLPHGRSLPSLLSRNMQKNVNEKRA